MINNYNQNLNLICKNVSSGIVFLAAVFIYMLTADSSVSYWDCPEYVTCASRLEIGHPPGNPMWMLAMRFVTIPFASQHHALVINIFSGVFMALVAFFLSRITFILASHLLHALNHKRINPERIPILAAAASTGAGLCFAFCDSAWFSAVEAEVYAMSTFLSALVVWLMLRWTQTSEPGKQNRLLILIAYITGLSLGIHQLNLLCIPVLALIFVFKRYPELKNSLRTWGAIFLSFIIIALILIGMMNGTLSWMQLLELKAVNGWGLPYFSGAFIYLVLLISSVVITAIAINRGSQIWILISLPAFLWISGFFMFEGNLWIALLLSILTSSLVIFGWKMSRPSLSTFLWICSFIILGYSSFALILIRGIASPPMNEDPPTDIFALASYISRDQYGSTPLFYGPTPYSKPIFEENWKPGKDLPDYSRYLLKKEKPLYNPLIGEARLNYRSKMLSASDSAANKEVENKGYGYLLSDFSFTRETTPELNMFLPRITGSTPGDLDNYASWIGMTPETMERVEISETIDSLGNHVGRMNGNGVRERTFSYRPTYLQNLQFFLSYQVGYMYFRYLLWNFLGRQNDLPSTGEIDHGNFITGLPPVDNLMLGNQSLMPPNASSENPGRNIYFGIPFILGLAGIGFLFAKGRTGRRTLAIVSMLFLMTGIAVVVYLNQTPGEPRERDYSFLGSYMAFCTWIGFGIVALLISLSKILRSRGAFLSASALIALSPGILMAAVNFDDHDRRGRSETFEFASKILDQDTDAIIFTQGDNFTFPLWYSQEVMDIGTGHTVIDVSYFGVPDYVINLMKQGDRGIRLTAKVADITYGAYTYTRIAPDADTVPVPALEAIKELYSQRSGQPVLRHRNVYIPGATPADTLVIDLKDLAGGGSMLPFRKLMLLDLIATNLATPTPRPIYFLTSLRTEFYKQLTPALKRIPYANVYQPSMTDRDHDSLVNSAIEIAIAERGSESGEIRYEDPVIADQRRRHRGELVIAARGKLESGETEEARRIIEAIHRLHPYTTTPAGSFTLADTTFHEGVEYVALLMDLSEKTDDPVFSEVAATTLDKMLHDVKDWRRYYASLPKWRRETVSNSSLRAISTIPRMENLRNRVKGL